MAVAAMACEVNAARAVPTTAGSTPKLVANANPLDTPPATGTITVPQDPKGVQITNTGRNKTATQTMLSKMVIS